MRVGSENRNATARLLSVDIRYIRLQAHTSASAFCLFTIVSIACLCEFCFFSFLLSLFSLSLSLSFTHLLISLGSPVCFSGFLLFGHSSSAFIFLCEREES